MNSNAKIRKLVKSHKLSNDKKITWYFFLSLHETI